MARRLRIVIVGLLAVAAPVSGASNAVGTEVSPAASPVGVARVSEDTVVGYNAVVRA